MNELVDWMEIEGCNDDEQRRMEGEQERMKMMKDGVKSRRMKILHCSSSLWPWLEGADVQNPSFKF